MVGHMPGMARPQNHCNPSVRGQCAPCGTVTFGDRRIREMSWNVTNTRVCPRACAAGALAVLLAASTMGVAQTSARQTTVPNAEIRKHIDREWFLKSLLQDNLGHWLTAAATPSGFFQVNLDRQWRPMGTRRGGT